MARRPRLLGTLVCALFGTIGGALVAVSTPSCTIFSGIVFDAGTAGSGGSSTSSSNTGTGGEPSTGLHYLSLADGAKFCSRLAECPEPELLDAVVDATAVPLDPTNYSFCMTWAAGPIPPDRIGFKYQQNVLKCMTDAKDCAAAAACNPREVFAGNDPRCAGKLDAGLDSGVEFCQGSDTVIRCDTGGDALHCENAYYAKSTCLEDQDGTHWCASGTDCHIDTECLGSVLNYCGNMSILQFSIDCSTLGLSCGTDARTSGIDCLTDGVLNTCDPSMFPVPAPMVCDGKTLKSCNGAYYSPFHCDALGGACDLVQAKAFCRRTTDTCTPFDPGFNKCDGDKAKLCVGGEEVDFDCASIGKSCAVSPAFGCH